jgi:endogenous inhibitor of DNA gyrase (YacG/DUF329 family)
MATTVKCPTCQRPVEWTPESAYRPFCSERCRLIDLGAWFDEKHRIPDESPGATDDPIPDSAEES